MKASEKELLEPVVEIISRYSMFEPGQRVGVAVSGGADSIGLLHVLFELAPRWNLRLHVLHLNHRLRGEESDGDAGFVREQARALGLPCTVEEADAALGAGEPGENLEQSAREARRAFFARALVAGAVDRVALGHTRDDQAETVLFRFLRGSGTSGLAAILPVTREGLVRPLIGVRRSAVRNYLLTKGIPWREDGTNADVRFARNKLRHELIPLLEREWNPALIDTLADMATLAQDDETYWREMIEGLATRHLAADGKAVLFRCSEVAAMPPAISRRLLREIVRRVKGNLRSIEFQHVEAILQLARSGEGNGRVQIPGGDVFRSFDWIRIAPPREFSLETRNYRYDVAPPVKVELPGGSVLTLEVTELGDKEPGAISRYNEQESVADLDGIPGSMVARNWRPGDQYRPQGSVREEKIKLLFQNARIPLWERRSWPVLACGDQIVWSRRFGVAAQFTPTVATRKLLRVKEIEKN